MHSGRKLWPLHSRYMADELEDFDKTFTYVELESGDHSLSIQRNRHRFFAEMDAFLSKYLKRKHAEHEVANSNDKLEAQSE